MARELLIQTTLVAALVHNNNKSNLKAFLTECFFYARKNNTNEMSIFLCKKIKNIFEKSMYKLFVFCYTKSIKVLLYLFLKVFA